MLLLKSDNRSLLVDAKYSYLNANNLSGLSSLVVTNSTGFARNDYVLLGNFGSEDSEIMQISSVTASTHTLVFTGTTKFSHAESTKVTILKYNKVRFYHTTTTTFSAGDPVKQKLGDSTTQFDITNPSGTTFRYTWDTNGTDPCILANVNVGDTLVINGQNFTAANNGTFVVTAVGTAGNNDFDITNASGVAENDKTLGTGSITASGYINIQPDDFYTKMYDMVNSTGYGWSIFYNSTTAKATANTNYIPYGDFAENTVKKILDGFFSLLNSKELRLISITEALAWLNEGFGIAQSELNLINSEYTVSAPVTVSIVNGTKEYALDDNLSNIIAVNKSDGTVIDPIDIADVPLYDSDAGNTMKYYIRGSYIGFSPTPTSDATVYLKKNTNTERLTSYTDVISLPDRGFEIIKDFMISRADKKLGKGTSVQDMQMFQSGVNRMKLVSHKRDNSEDSWSVSDQANV